MQNISNENNMLIRIFGVSVHGKSEVDSCGGHLKTACRHAIAMGENLRCSSDCVSFLNTKFDERYISPSYFMSNIAEQTLQDDRKVRKDRKQYKN